MNNKGKLIVFEGADGTGKTTQAKLLFNFLRKNKVGAVLISFPMYEQAWGKMVRRYLNGEFGALHQVNPYFASMLYAGDRLNASTQIKKWLGEGKIIVCDRYVASNIAHQAAKLKSKSEKLKFINWLEDLEYKQDEIPKPDFVILLTIPNAVAQKFMAKRARDIHEVDTQYQQRVANEYLNYAKGKKNWVVVSNMKGNKLRSLGDVHKEIAEKLGIRARP